MPIKSCGTRWSRSKYPLNVVGGLLIFKETNEMNHAVKQVCNTE